MATPSTNPVTIARVAAGLWDLQFGNATMDWAIEELAGETYKGDIYALVEHYATAGFATHALMAQALVHNMVELNVDDLDADLKTYLVDYVTAVLDDPSYAGNEGKAIVDIVSAFATMEEHSVTEIADAAKAFNSQIDAAIMHASTDDTLDGLVHPPVVDDTEFTILDAMAAGASVMQLSGNQDVRIDFTNPDHQIKGLDLDGDGTIENDAEENNPAYLEANDPMVAAHHSGYVIVDAHSRNPLNHTDAINNFLGDIYFDGTGFDGDGTNTDGNIVLGGLGADIVLGGIGNDFFSGGGVASAGLTGGNQGSGTNTGGQDRLDGGRNADFFFAELSLLDPTEGNRLTINAGNTSDDAAVGNNTPQDTDWLLIQASDDEDGTVINLSVETNQTVRTGAGTIISSMTEVENVDASGNLYGFLDDLEFSVGGGMIVEGADGEDENVALGSSAQLHIIGSVAANRLIGGFDNDLIEGDAGGDLLMGGNLHYLNDPNMLGIVNDGMDELFGGTGNDNIVFEADSGIIDGGADNDTLWVTDLALGTRSVADMIADGVLRLDLKAQDLDQSAGYGGDDTSDTQDQTNYNDLDVGGRVAVSNMESVIATGLGAIDYWASGANPAEDLAFRNQQNHLWYAGDLDLRGTDGVNTLYASVGDDTLEGRMGGTSTFNAAGVLTGDNRDKLSGGAGSDDFVFALGVSTGDGVDVIHRQTNLDVDGDGAVDNLTDGTFGVDFGEEGPVIASNSSLTLELPTGATINVAGVSFLFKGVAYTLNDLASPTYVAFTAALNVALDADPALDGLTATLNADNSVTIQDAAGGVFAKNPAGGWLVTGTLPPDGTSSWKQTVGDPATDQDQDRLIYAAYEDRLDGELVDDQTTTGSAISLGVDSYAEDLVIDFKTGANGKVSTSIAEDQVYVLTFTNLTTEDTVTITVNGVKYSLQVGVDLDGNEIAGEELAGQGGTAASQTAIQTAFLTRLASFINTFMDDDTASGELAASSTATTLTLVQADYNGEETVFMRTPIVELINGSAGEKATVSTLNTSEHEVELYEFDGRGGELNDTNVLFWGDQSVSRAILETGAGAAGTANTIGGSEALVIDGGGNTLQSVIFGTTTAIADNTATNSFLRTDFTVHGDDLLLGGVANDTITAGTGDDRVIGSLGTDTADGGKSFYAVQVLGEPQARVYVLNQWEATNPSKVSALSALNISSINRIGDSESGNSTPSSTGLAEVFNDTLQFQQADFSASTTFTITLDNFAGTSASTLEFRNGGAGKVTVDDAGNSTVDGTTTFTNFENIRTVSGTGLAVADSGQGNDTLDVAALSAVSGGISYDLTNRNDGDDAVNATGAGRVSYSTNDHGSLTRPADTDFETLIIKVDGVENVITDNATVISGDDLLMIDETEAAKHNRFVAGEGDDRIEYLNTFTGEAIDGAAEPQVTIKVDTTPAATGGTDTVTMTGGRVGTTKAVDTLEAVEYIALDGNTAEGQTSGVDRVDVIDVTSLTSGATVNYVDGTIKVGGTLHLTIEGIVEMEKVIADGNDVVIVADAATMNTNARSDENNATPDTNILFMTYRDFDDLNSGATTRKSFAAQVADDTVTNVINQGQFQFSLSEVGTDLDVDRVDYSNEAGRIVVPVGQGVWTTPGAATNKPQYVVVDGDQDNVFNDGESRVDALWSVEEIVAAKGESVMDFTAVGAARQITFQYTSPSSNPSENQTLEQTIRIADGTGNSLTGLNAFVERYTYNKTTSPVADATWNRVEGSDAAEVIIYQGSEDLVNQSGLDHRFTTDTLTLRGGSNEVRYSSLETSISASITVTEENTSTASVAEGGISAVVTFQDGKGVGVPSATFLGGTHTITSYTSDNSTAAGNLKIEGSQDAEDVVAFTSTSNKTFVLGVSPGVINVNIGALNTMVLTGFEYLQDAGTNDVYSFSSLASAFGLTLIDSTADHDAIKVGNDAIAFNTGTALNISLDALSSNVDGADADILPGFNFDFDVLDVTGVTTSGLTLAGGTDAAPANADLDLTDEVVLGALSLVTTINNFESMVLTAGSVTAGTTFTFNPQSNTLAQGSTTVTTSADILSFGGTVLEGTNRGLLAPGATAASSFADVSTGVTILVAGTTGATVIGGSGNDTFTGGGGNDSFQGNGGTDTFDGGTAAEVRTIQLDGILDAAANTVTITLDGNAYVLTEVAALVDTDPDLGDNLDIIQGAGSDAVGAALASLVTANLDELNLTAAFGGTDLVSVTYSATTDLLTFTFAAGADVLVTDTIAIADTDGGTFAASSESVVTEGGGGGVDTFVFSTTASQNGADVLNNFQALNTATDDLLDFTAFLGAYTLTVGDVNFATGVDLNGGGSQVAVVFNKTGALASGDIQLADAAGKISLADNAKAVVLVTADTDGDTDATVTAYSIYYVEDTDTGAGQSYSVTLVGTINNGIEIDGDNFTAGTDAFV